MVPEMQYEQAVPLCGWDVPLVYFTVVLWEEVRVAFVENPAGVALEVRVCKPFFELVQRLRLILPPVVENLAVELSDGDMHVEVFVNLDERRCVLDGFAVVDELAV